MTPKRRSTDLVHRLVVLAAACLLVLSGCSTGSSQQEDLDDAPEPTPMEESQEEPPGETVDEPPQQAQQPPAEAGTQPAEPAPAEQHAAGGPADDAPTEAQVDAFVDTYEEVVTLQKDYQGQINAAESPDKVQQLRQQANAEIEQTIDDGQLPRQQFLAIMEQMQHDADLRQRIDQKIDLDG
jgi:hypothetical protein